ncbi:MAG: aminomethyl-transferring glycine dehydrogenase subunit GcvPA [bacterium]|nr:aminomethyl-transferring glycine dehydrogenase subunit GcvPA [bacterium]
MPFIPHTEDQRAAMLKTIGVSSFEELLAPVPSELILTRELDIPPAHGEIELHKAANALLNNTQRIPMNRCFAGGGFYPHHVPAVVDELARRGEFYSAYTPYQPEVSQGLLQMIYEWQSYICMLTGMDIANASGYDGGTTLADAVLMAKYVHKEKRRKVVFAPHVNLDAVEIVATYNLGMEMELVECPEASDGRIDRNGLDGLLGDDTAAVVFQFPDALGYIEEDLADLIAQVQAAGALAIVSFYAFAAGLMKTPGELGADIVCGEAQCFGNYMGYGGPVCGFLACREKYVRVLPGRLIGRTKAQRNNDDGERIDGEGFVMTLQAREQHIRREKATSNICTNQTLLALRSTIYLGAIGRQGFVNIAAQCHQTAVTTHKELRKIAGVDDFYGNRPFFNEFTLRFQPGKRNDIYAEGLKRGILAGIKPVQPVTGLAVAGSTHDGRLDDCLTFAFTEVHGKSDIDALIKLVKEVLA